MDPTLQQTLMLLAQQSQEAQRARQMAAQAQSRPINRRLANPGQSAADVLLRPTGAQSQAMMAAAAGMTNRRRGELPISSLTRGTNAGLNLLNQIRQEQRQNEVGGLNAQAAAFESGAGNLRANMHATAQMQSAINNANRPAREPSRPNSVKEYEFAKENGFEGTYQEWLDRPSPAQLAKQADAQEKAGELDKAEVSKAEWAVSNAEITLNNINRAIQQSEGLFATGLGSYLPEAINSQSRNLRRTLQQVKSTIGFDRLQRMRDQSPTGGALGQVSQMELSQLNSALGSLDNEQDEKQLQYNLEVVKRVYEKIQREARAYLGSESSSEVTSEATIDDLLSEYQ